MTAGTLAIEVATRDDLSEVDALLARAYPALLKPDYPPSVMVLALPLIARANPRLFACGTYYVARRDGEIVGAGGWTPSARAGPHVRPRVGDVRHVVTDQRHTRRGIGRALMARAFETAAAAGITRLEAQATRTAVPFYRALGFTVLRPTEVPLRPGIVFPAVIMVRSLRDFPSAGPVPTGGPPLRPGST